MSEEIKDAWYRPGPTIQEFHASDHLYRFLIGARGSSKTTSVAMEAIRHGYHNAGAKIGALRKTETSQASTSLKTFDFCYRNLGALYQPGARTLFQSWNDGMLVRLPSREAIAQWNEFLLTNPNKSQQDSWLKTEGDRLCSFLEFKGVKDAKMAEQVLRGWEVSLLILIEGDQMERSDFDLATACLRWKAADGKLPSDAGIILETNPPSPQHWIAKLEEEATEKNWQEFRFWHIPTKENAHNLPTGYVENLEKMYSHNQSMLKRMVYGEYAEAHDGDPVYYAFSEAYHVFSNLPWPKGAYLIRGWDFGAFNACVWMAYFEQLGIEHIWAMKELYIENGDTDRQCKEVAKITEDEFPFFNDRSICSGVYDFCDPAGASMTSKGSDIQILKNNGFHDVKYNLLGTRSLQVTLAIVNRVLETSDSSGQRIFRIDKDGCPKLYSGMSGGYRYPKEHEPGWGTDKAAPMKGPIVNNVDHVCFVAGTMIQTIDGDCPIELLEVGDRVWTRYGIQPIIKWAKSEEEKLVLTFEFEGERKVTCTPDHPFWSNGKWRAIGSLKRGEKCLMSNNRERALINRSPSWMEHVYTMTIDIDHEFYANDFLCGNCDAFRYGSINIMKLGKSERNIASSPTGIMAQKRFTNPSRFPSARTVKLPGMR